MLSRLARRVSTCVLALLIVPSSAVSICAAESTPTTSNGDIVLWAKKATNINGAWSLVEDATAAGGVRIANPDAGASKLATAAAAPASYFELPFVAETGRQYRLWIRGKAQNDSWQNDSTFVQFSGSVAADGTAAFRIGTTSAAVVSIEESSGAGVAGWGWQDNGYGAGVFGPTIAFDSTQQTLRVQVREDGLSIDQIVLSPVTYTTAAPGAAKNDTTILPATVWNREVVLYAKNATTINGAWSLVDDATAAGGSPIPTPARRSWRRPRPHPPAISSCPSTSNRAARIACGSVARRRTTRGRTTRRSCSSAAAWPPTVHPHSASAPPRPPSSASKRAREPA